MKVAILGTMSSRMLAPYNDPDWEIWVCSPGNAYGVIPRVTRWFELHGIVDLKGSENADWNEKYFDWLKTQSFPVYMQEPNDLLPEIRVFPRMGWLKTFGNWGRMAATSSISLMVGYAIMQGAEEIGIWGVDMQADSEAYSRQKDGCQIMLNLARERYGIKITIPLESCLATMPPFYGYAEASRMGRRLLARKLELEQQFTHAKGQIRHWENTFHEVKGLLDMLNYVSRTFVDGVDDAELDIEETLEGDDTSVIHPKGTTVDFEAMATVTGDETDPRSMPVRKFGNVLIPESATFNTDAAE